MNRNRYRLVRNRATGIMTPVAEFARAFALAPCAALALGAPAHAIDGNALPTGGVAITGGVSIGAPVGNTLTVTQTGTRDIIHWNSFDIGANAAVNFLQPSSTAAVLNRVVGGGPGSVIAGQLTANGQIYLLNPNGILFAGGSQTNVASLVASTLEMDDALFLNPNGFLSNAPDEADFVWNGTAEAFQQSLIRVEADARIATALGGVAILVAPTVQNAGVIETPGGQAALAGGAKVYLSFLEQQTFDDAGQQAAYLASLPPALRGLNGMLVEVSSFNGTDANGQQVNLTGAAVNESLGKIIAESGNVTLASFLVNQSGRISVTTTVNGAGTIRLLARDSDGGADDKPVAGAVGGVYEGDRAGVLVLGENSMTEALPDVSDTATSQDAQAFNPGAIELVGNSIDILAGSTLVATGGDIVASAVIGADPARLYVDGGAVLDAAGVSARTYDQWNAMLAAFGRSDEAIADGELVFAMASNVIAVELRSAELADAPLQQGSFVNGSTVYVDVREGTEFADISGWVAQIGRTAAERSASGGNITLNSAGDLVIRDGATLDVSGGVARYESGFVNTTQLSLGGLAVDISDASPDVLYNGFVVAGAGNYEQGYTQGYDAGTITLGGTLAVEGTLLGGVTVGERQRADIPEGGTLVIGTGADIALGASTRLLGAGFGPGDALDGEWLSTLELDPARMIGMQNLALATTGKISIADGTTLDLGVGGSLDASAREIDVLGHIVTPGGTVMLETRDTGQVQLGAGAHDIVVQGSIDVAGLWTNDTPGIGNGLDAVALDGGSITLDAYSDLTLAATSVLDVSGGAWLDAVGDAALGNAGAISLAVGRFGASGAGDAQTSVLTLGGSLLGYAAGSGGTLELSASSVWIVGAGGGAGGGAPGELVLDTEFFGQGGFLNYAIDGVDGLTLAAGAQLAPLAKTWVLNANASTQASGREIATFSTTQVPDPLLRSPGSVALSASGIALGNLTVEEGAAIAVDPGGGIDLYAGQNLTMLGSALAHGGRITLATPIPPDDFFASQSIWLGDASLLDVSGIARTYVGADGLVAGEVLDGGSVSITASQGYLVALAGSLIDVSGATGTLHVRNEQGVWTQTSIASDGGAVTLFAREGMLLDGAFQATGGSSQAEGGSLAIEIARTEVPIGFAYPSAPRVIEITAQAGFVPAGLDPFDDIDAANNGIARIAQDTLDAAGFDRVALSAQDGIRFAQDATLATRKELALSAPSIELLAGVTATLDSAYVALGGIGASGAASGGDALNPGVLNVNGDLIDLFSTTLLGVSAANFSASGDIRLNGSPTDTDGDAVRAPDALIGTLRAAGDVSFVAAQVYPTTFTQYAIDIAAGALGADGVSPALLAVLPNGADAAAPLSAAATLTARAPEILVEGTLRAPFGEIALSADETLTLATGSLVSVSGEDQTVLFGQTLLSGLSYTYDLDGVTLVINAATLPDKTVSLSAPVIDQQAGSVIDLSGGGDLLAWEFVPGIGGTQDVLDTTQSYAILPGFSSAFAPNDPMLAGGGPAAGEQVYLSGGPNLPAGAYTLLPARYALLPGALLVTAQGNTGMIARDNYTLADGSQVVSGYLTSANADGSVTRDALSSGFLVQTQATVNAQSEYLLTSASAFFAENAAQRQTGDAGRLVVQVVSSPNLAESLNLAGSLLAERIEGALGTEVDIVAQNLVVLGTGGASVDTAGAVVLDAARITALGADSVLLGGVREARADGVFIDVQADTLVLANSASSALSGGEILLAATDTLTLAEGSAVSGSGAASGVAPIYLLGDTAAGVSGDGALLRVASGAQATIVRDNVGSASGVLNVAQGASVGADGSITLDATLDNVFSGTLALGDNGSLRLGSSGVSLGEVPDGTSGLVMDAERLAGLAELGELVLKSYSSIDLYGDLAGLPRLGALTLETPAIVGMAVDGATQDAVLSADRLVLANPDGAAGVVAGGAGTLTLEADEMVFGAGAVALGGYANAVLVASASMLASGAGELDMAGGLILAAPRVEGAKLADYTWRASGDLAVVAQGDAPAGDAEGVGARLAFEAGDALTLDGRIESTAGEVVLLALNDVTLSAQSVIDVAGYAADFADLSIAVPAGRIHLTSTQGDVAAAGLIDASGAAGGDAGTLEVDAAQGEFVLTGSLLGGAAAGADGTLGRQGGVDLDVATVTGFDALDGALEAGGFTASRIWRVRQGDVSIARTAVAQNFELYADDGSITLDGTIDARGADGGRVVLAAARGDGGAGNVVVNGSILANAMGDAQGDGDGGYVMLASATADGSEPAPGFATVTLGTSALVDVSGAGAGEAGELYLRAPSMGATDVAVDLAGQVTGASRVTLEAFKTFQGATLDAALIASMQAQHGVAALDPVALQGALDFGGAPLTLVAGYELRDAGDITVSGEVNFSGLGVLTVRAGGDLLINKSLSDGFSTAATSGVPQAGDSWSYRLVGGADLEGANPLALLRPEALLAGSGAEGSGDVQLAAATLVRTGAGFIDIAAAGDLTAAAQTSVIYTAGVPVTPAGLVYTVPTSTQGASFPDQGGDVRILAQGDIVFAPSSQLVVEWLWRQGWLKSDGTLANGTGAVLGTIETARPNPAWWVNFAQFQQGVGALGGGSVSIAAGGDIVDVSVAIPNNGRLGGAAGTAPDLANLVVQGGGDLAVSAGGDILGGLYYVADGTAAIHAGGAVGASPVDTLTPYPVLAFGDAQVALDARADVTIQDALDPLLLLQVTANAGIVGIANNLGRESYFSGYGDSALSAVSAAGDVTLAASHALATRNNIVNPDAHAGGLLPPSLALIAPSGDITLSSDIRLYPGEEQDLRLLAGGTLALPASITMLDLAPAFLPFVTAPDHAEGELLFVPSGVAPNDPALPLAFQTDPVYLVALDGDVIGRAADTIAGVGIELSKPFYVQAQGDIVNLSIVGQHYDAADVSRVLAGGDIRFETDTAGGDIGAQQDDRTLRVGGPGRLEVLAGADIDLGASAGIVSVGASDNPFLPTQGADLLVAAGLGVDAQGQVKLPDYAGFAIAYLGAGSAALDRYWERQEELIRRELEHDGGTASDAEAQARLVQAQAEFADLDQETQVARVFFNELREGGLEGGATLDYSLGKDAIAALFPDVDESGASGDINLFFSQIKTEQGGDLVLFAPTGGVNAGLANPGGLSKPASQLGIVTVGGGNIWSLVDQDFLVNQSRVFTLKGGDILLWSEHGDIDAGRGSKTASATPPPRRTVRNGAIVLDVTGSIAGSGIGVLLSDAAVVPGDVDLIAPEGSINAGDAGIRAAGNINIAAVTVIGADNISVGGISTGAALAAPAVAPVSTGNVASEATRATESIAQAVADAARAQEELKKSFRPSFITVEVIGLGEG